MTERLICIDQRLVETVASIIDEEAFDFEQKRLAHQSSGPSLIQELASSTPFRVLGMGMFGIAAAMGIPDVETAYAQAQKPQPKPEQSKPQANCPVSVGYRENGNDRRAVLELPGKNLAWKTDSKGIGREQTRAGEFPSYTDPGTGIEFTRFRVNSPDGRTVRGKWTQLDSGTGTPPQEVSIPCSAPGVKDADFVLDGVSHARDKTQDQPRYIPQSATKFQTNQPSTEQPSQSVVDARQALNKLSQEGQSQKPQGTQPTRPASGDQRARGVWDYETPIIGGIRRFVESPLFIPVLVAGAVLGYAASRHHRVHTEGTHAYTIPYWRDRRVRVW